MENESSGVRVQCNRVHGVCSITLSGWHFGRTGGLLGVYDNEPFNDWMKPDRLLLIMNYPNALIY